MDVIEEKGIAIICGNYVYFPFIFLLLDITLSLSLSLSSIYNIYIYRFFKNFENKKVPLKRFNHEVIYIYNPNLK